MKINNKYRYTAVVGSSDRQLKRASKLFFICTIGAFLCTISSCKKMLDIEPSKEKIELDVVFGSDITAVSAMAGIYFNLITDGFAAGTDQSILFVAGMSADELMYRDQNRLDMIAFEKNQLLPENSVVKSNWTSLYKSIYNVNAMLEGLKDALSISSHVKQQLRGEALFVRAFCYFYLVNLFGEVPVITKTSYQENSRASREPIDVAYHQIVEDLMEAQNLLPDSYVIGANLPSTDRVRVNKSAARALLARVYLYQEDWEKANFMATQIINNTGQYAIVSNLNEVFLKNSKEAIWQLMPSFPGYNTFEGLYSIVTNPDTYSFKLSDELVNSFEKEDIRMINWIRSFNNGNDTIYFSYKYKISTYGASVTEYSMVLRLAEQYLIRAEARAHIDSDLMNAISDVDVIRKRAGLSLVKDTNPGISRDDLLLVIEQERRREFFVEWGHRWFDLKRWNKADAILAPLKSPNWQSTDVLYPLPQSEMDKNPNLRPQNPGY